MKATTAIILDTRYIKDSPEDQQVINRLNTLDKKGRDYREKRQALLKKLSCTFPVRLRVTYQKTQKYFPTDYNLTQAQWDKMHSNRPDTLKETELQLKSIESKAKQIIDKLLYFSFDEFHNLFSNRKRTGLVSAAFDSYITQTKKEGRIGSSIAYENAKKSLIEFDPDLTFSNLTKDKLQEYKEFMKQKGNSDTSIGFYLRSLRAIFNIEINENRIEASLYPFRVQKGSKRKIIPGSKRGVGPISREAVAAIFNLNLEPGSIIEQTRDYFLFMYECNGITPTNLFRLRFDDVNGEFISFYREKTKNTVNEPNLIKAYIKENMAETIRKHGNKERIGEYLFPVINPKMSFEESYFAIKDFTNLMNKNLKKIAKLSGIKQRLSTYVARHSYATHSRDYNVNITHISKSLGHGNIATTNAYLSGLPESIVKENAGVLVELKKNSAKVVNL